MNGTSQILLVSGAGLGLAVMVLLIARRGILSMRYTLGWLFVAVCLIAGGLFGGIVDYIAEALNVEPVAIVFTAVMVGFLGIAVQLSISVSGLTELVRTLAESNAILEQRVVQVASQQPPSPAVDESVRVELEELEDTRDER